MSTSVATKKTIPGTEGKDRKKGIKAHNGIDDITGRIGDLGNLMHAEAASSTKKRKDKRGNERESHYEVDDSRIRRAIAHGGPNETSDMTRHYKIGDSTHGDVNVSVVPGKAPVRKNSNPSGSFSRRAKGKYCTNSDDSNTLLASREDSDVWELVKKLEEQNAELQEKVFEIRKSSQNLLDMDESWSMAKKMEQSHNEISQTRSKLAKMDTEIAELTETNEDLATKVKKSKSLIRKLFKAIEDLRSGHEIDFVSLYRQVTPYVNRADQNVQQEENELYSELESLKSRLAQHNDLICTVEKARSDGKVVLVTKRGCVTTTMKELHQQYTESLPASVNGSSSSLVSAVSLGAQSGVRPVHPNINSLRGKTSHSRSAQFHNRHTSEIRTINSPNRFPLGMELKHSMSRSESSLSQCQSDANENFNLRNAISQNNCFNGNIESINGDSFQTGRNDHDRVLDSYATETDSTDFVPQGHSNYSIPETFGSLGNSQGKSIGNSGMGETPRNEKVWEIREDPKLGKYFFNTITGAKTTRDPEKSRIKRKKREEGK